jgi:glyoxylase-like metal-dependent hydrolase (beta-lactamase superfamily II)
VQFRCFLSLLRTAGLLAQVAPPDATQRAASDRPEPAVTRVAEGVYLFVTPPYSDVGRDGNAIAMVGPDGVLVFDANGTPAAAEAVLAKIRQITPQPVKLLVLSHWYWDHWYGAEVYAAAFPALDIIAHERTRALMAGPAIAFNAPGLKQLPGHIRAVEARIEQLRGKAPDSPEIAKFERHLAPDRFFLV